MEEKKNNEKIDLEVIFKKIIQKRRIFYYVLPITFIISVIFILGFPRYYTTDIKLAPELNSSMNSMGGTLSSLASSFGFDSPSLPEFDGRQQVYMQSIQC